MAEKPVSRMGRAELDREAERLGVPNPRYYNARELRDAIRARRAARANDDHGGQT